MPHKDLEEGRRYHWKLRRKKNRRCQDCGIWITDKATRCQPCDRKIGYRAYTDGIKFHSSGRALIKYGGKWQYRCRVIASDILGRPLKDGEIVHHINGNFQDDRPENLLICTLGYHRELHMKMAEAYMQEHFGKI